MASAPTVDLTPLERELNNLAPSIRDNPTDDSWTRVTTISQEIANNLRAKGGLVDYHTLLGKSDLPQTLSSLIGSAVKGSTLPDESRAPAMIELLRVGANLCMDHDANREALLEVGFPQAALSLLEAYVETIPPLSSAPVPLTLTLANLKIIRTAIGVLLNASLGYDPVKTRLNSLEAALTIIKLAAAVYPPNAWAEEQLLTSEVAENWALRSGISSWSWRTVSALRDGSDESVQILNGEVLPWTTPHLLKFCPSHSPQTSDAIASDPDLYDTLVQADFEFLEEACTLIESLALDVEDVRLELPRKCCYPSSKAVPCISPVLDFIEYGTYPTSWESGIFDDTERQSKQKSFGIFKAALIKAVVEVFGEEKNEEVLWVDVDKAHPGGQYVERMIRWVSQQVDAVPSDNPSSQHRDDMAICGTLSLGNLVRKGSIAVALLSPPYSLAALLSSDSFLSRTTDIKVKHGALGFLKHLAQHSKSSPVVPSSFYDVHIIERIVASGVWDDKSDVMAEVVQLSAIGVAKHLCNASLDHTFSTVLAEDADQPSALSQILDLVKRSDSISVKSEGSRVLVNVVKSLWFNERTSPDSVEGRQKKREACISKVLSSDCALVLTGLVARSIRYPILVNEGIVAMSLFCLHKTGGSLILEHLTTPITPNPASSAEEALSPTSEAASPSVTSPSRRQPLTVPKHALDMLIAVLRNVDNPVNFPTEVRINACTFFLQLQRHNSPESLVYIRELVAPVVKKVAEDAQESEGGEKLAKAATQLFKSWEQRPPVSS